MLLLDKQTRNTLFRAIQEEGFEPSDFTVEHAGVVWRLTHRAWQSRFELAKASRALMMTITYTVGDATRRTVNVGSTSDSRPLLREWLRQIKADHETPDLWAELDGEQRISELAEGQENTPFSEVEQQQIADTVAEVLAQARDTYELPEAQLRLLEAKLDYLVEAAGHSRRIDWLNTAVGAVAGAFAGGVLTPEVVQKVLGALGAGLGPLFGHPLPVLGP